MGLVITRSVGQAIIVDDKVKIILLRTKGQEARLLFQDVDPKSRTPVDRFERWEQEQKEVEKNGMRNGGG